jgi:hypothetical protein
MRARIISFAMDLKKIACEHKKSETVLNEAEKEWHERVCEKEAAATTTQNDKNRESHHLTSNFNGCTLN